MKKKLNLEVSDEVNVGVSTVWDTKTFKEIWTQAVYKPVDTPNSFYFLRADLTRSLISAGCDQILNDRIHHSFEAVFGWKGFKGIQGHPVAMRGGVEYYLSDQTRVTASGSWDDSYYIEQEVEHEIDSHWTVSATQAFDSSVLQTKQSPYHIGFAAAYKL
jgi:hypothetical protein